jgi:hypothetical protein
MSALNHNSGKPKWSLLLTDFADELREVLRVREVIESTGKYDRMNFAMSQGKPESKVFLEDNLDSIERHLFDRRANKHTDPETQCYHMAHICVRALIDLSYALEKECEDILQEDASLQCIEPRYPWHEAPEWATCGAIDANGYGIWYAERPEPHDLQWIANNRAAMIWCKMLRDGEDWRDTLEMKP